jgi:sugar lactone lactonase YvrE
MGNIKHLFIVFITLISFSVKGQSLWFGHNQNSDHAWDIAFLTYSQSSASLGTVSNGIYFKSDGTTIYRTSSTSVSQYSLTSNNLSTLSLKRSYNTGYTLNGVYFKSDGTKMYVLANVTSAWRLREYSLSTPWDISTASPVASFDVFNQDTAPTGLTFSTDGTKIYITGNTNNSIYYYNLSSAWSISTMTYNNSFSTNTYSSTPIGISLDVLGRYVYVVNGSSLSKKIIQYSLTSNFDISTAVYLKELTLSATYHTSLTDIFFMTSGNICYISDTNLKIIKYIIQ